MAPRFLREKHLPAGMLLLLLREKHLPAEMLLLLLRKKHLPAAVMPRSSSAGQMNEVS